MSAKSLLAIGGAAILFLAGGGANAGEKIKLSGNEACYTVSADELQLDEGHSAILFRDNCVDFDEDPNAFGHLSTGDCVGLVEIRPDETYDVSGFCTFTYRDGSKDFERFWETSEMEAGRWEIFGGTGKLAGATGGGTYAGGPVTDTISHYKIDGEYELP